MLIHAGDTFVAAKYSTETVAAVGAAGGFITPIYILGFGLILGISPILARKSGEKEDISKYLFTTVLYSVVITVVFTALSEVMILFTPYFGFKSELVPLMQRYLRLFALSFGGVYIYSAVKEYLQSSEKTILANSISVVAVFVNLIINLILVFGFWFIPSLGIEGLAIASITVRFLMAFSLLFLVRKEILCNVKIEWGYLKDVVKLSIPIGVGIFAEVCAFCVVTILIAGIDTLQVAASSIIMTVASITFMVPLSVSVAAAVRAGKALGEQNLERIRVTSNSAFLISTSFMAISALTFFIVPEWVIGLFTSDTKLIDVAIPILLVAAIFQLADGIQVTLSGLLRGLGKATPALIVMLIGYWLIGIPLGHYLAIPLQMKALGYWIGLATSLFVVSGGLYFLYRQYIKQLFRRA